MVLCGTALPIQVDETVSDEEKMEEDEDDVGKYNTFMWICVPPQAVVALRLSCLCQSVPKHPSQQPFLPRPFTYNLLLDKLTACTFTLFITHSFRFSKKA